MDDYDEDTPLLYLLFIIYANIAWPWGWDLKR